MAQEVENFIVGKSYRYSELPEASDTLTVNDYGEENLGQNAVHIRCKDTGRDVWFIFDGMTNVGQYKCVYNS